MWTKEDVIGFNNNITLVTLHKADKEGIDLHKLSAIELSQFVFEAIKEELK